MSVATHELFGVPVAHNGDKWIRADDAPAISLARIEQAFNDVKALKVAFVGEKIFDEYVYISPLSKPSKEFVVCGAIRSTERFKGGIVAAASHLKGLCSAEIVSQTDFIQHTIVKRRYVEAGITRKLFETYSRERVTLETDERRFFESRLQDAVERADVVIVIDFGHGLIDEDTRQILYGAKFLAVNAQTNAGNQGFNPVTNYTSADYVCVDLPEARLAVQDATATPHELIEYISRAMGASHVIVTHGREGAYWANGSVPAFASKPIDTMGAGDCFLALTAPLIAAGLPIEEAAFVGSVAAGMKTEIVGHRESVHGPDVLRKVRELLQ